MWPYAAQLKVEAVGDAWSFLLCCVTYKHGALYYFLLSCAKKIPGDTFVICLDGFLSLFALK